MRDIGLAILGVVFALAFEAWDPFSISTSGSKALEAAYYNITSGLYPHRRRPSTATVLISDADLRAQSMDWPLDYIQHASLLRAIGAAKPKALVIDFFFADDRETSSRETLIDVVRRLSCEFPVILLKPPNSVGLDPGWAGFYADVRTDGFVESPVENYY